MDWQGLDCGVASFPLNLLFIVINGFHSFKHILSKIFIFITLNYCSPVFLCMGMCTHLHMLAEDAVCWSWRYRPCVGNGNWTVFPVPSVYSKMGNQKHFPLFLSFIKIKDT